MDFITLKTLIESVKLGSFSKAASSLCVTQSAVSRRIKLLEDHYGEQLIDRSGPTIKPTAAGKLLMEKALQVLKIEQDFIQGLHALTHKRKISFCCTVPFGTAYLPDIFTEFMSRNAESSDLNFVFEMPEIALRGLKENRFDLVLIEYCEDLNLTEYLAFPLPDDEMVFVSSPSFDIDPLVDIEMMLSRRLYCKKDGCCARRFLEKSMQTMGREAGEFSNTVFFDDIPFIIRAVMAGEGISFISRSIVEPYLQNGTLRAHHVNDFDRARPRRLILNDRRSLDPLLLDFISGIYGRFDLSPPAALSSTP